VLEICENLYDYAAKCNRHIGSATDSSYQSNQQASNEYAVCSFISSVIQGSYDEYGYIYIDSGAYSKDNKYNAYANAAERRDVVTTGQFIGLIFFALVFSGFTYKASLMRTQVEKKLGFDPSSREPLGADGYGFTRQDSGIMMCRSKSNISTYEAPNHSRIL
jgi:hypothetical protein